MSATVNYTTDFLLNYFMENVDLGCNLKFNAPIRDGIVSYNFVSFLWTQIN
jgi:hypothetical protein